MCDLKPHFKLQFSSPRTNLYLIIAQEVSKDAKCKSNKILNSCFLKVFVEWLLSEWQNLASCMFSHFPPYPLPSQIQTVLLTLCNGRVYLWKSCLSYTMADLSLKTVNYTFKLEMCAMQLCFSKVEREVLVPCCEHLVPRSRRQQTEKPAETWVEDEWGTSMMRRSKELLYLNVDPASGLAPWGCRIISAYPQNVAIS